jgi:hypothetical protein
VTLLLLFPLAFALIGFYGERGRQQVEEVDTQSKTVV